MPKLTIDNRRIEVPEGTKVIEAAERLGIIIPRFCYHPALGSVGACRVCAVMFKEGPVKGVQMSCMTDAKDDMVVSTTDDEVVAFRKYVIEWLMLNHPHDCPVCDEGGQCLLQDQTISGGHGRRRYPGKKRTYHDQDLGPFVQHEMNRCIHCWRCRRFYQDFAGYRDLGAMQLGNRTYFGRFGSGPLESPFAGNLIDLCPTGVYTDKPARFKARRWDLQRSPSLCIHCSLGCNIVANARYRAVVRLEARVNETVNGHFICDRGRFGFDYANHPERLRQPRVDDREVTWDEAMQAAAARLAETIRRNGPEAVAILGSERSSLETQAALLRLARSKGWRDPDFFSAPGREQKVKSAIAGLNPEVAVSMGDIAKSDFIILIGVDPVNEAPMLALALRQAHRRGGTVAAIDPRPVCLPFALDHLPVSPGAMSACLNILVKKALRPEDLTALGKAEKDFFDALPDEYSPNENLQEPLDRLSNRLRASEHPVFVCGTDIVRQTIPALAAEHIRILRAANKAAGLFYVLPGPNAFGAALMASASEPAALSVAEAVAAGSVRALVVAEADPLWDVDNQDRFLKGLDGLELLIVLDYLPSPMAQRADILMPTLTIFEKHGCSFVNQEGRYQRAVPVHHGGLPIIQSGGGSHPPHTFVDHVPGAGPRAAWSVLSDLADDVKVTGEDTRSIRTLWTWLAEAVPALAPIAPNASEPDEGVRVFLPNPPTAAIDAFNLTPEDAPTGQLELLLVDATFGTEELSDYSHIVRQAQKPPVLLMHAQDASRLDLPSGTTVSVTLPDGDLSLPLQVHANMASGVIVMPRHRQLNWHKLNGRPVMIPEAGLRKI